MDAQRFGRALGIGVREGARALKNAADAAAAPNPHVQKTGAGTAAARSPGSETQPGRESAGRVAARGVMEARKTGRALGQGGKRFGEAVWAPAARAGGVLWYEVTGVFFGLFALAAATEIWKRRADFALGGEPRTRVLFAVVMFLVFGAFTWSSFRKARARQNR